MTGSPGPLKVVTSQLPGDIEHLADERKLGYGADRKSSGRQRIGIDTTKGNLCSAIALGTGWHQGKTIEISAGTAQGRI